MGVVSCLEGEKGNPLFLFQKAGLHFEIKRLVKYFILWLL